MGTNLSSFNTFYVKDVRISCNFQLARYSQKFFPGESDTQNYTQMLKFLEFDSYMSVWEYFMQLTQKEKRLVLSHFLLIIA